MAKDPNCVFCKIAAGEIPAHKIWEDADHIAFLNLNPNTEGFTVLATKEHYDSYFANLRPEVLNNLMAAAQTVAKRLDEGFDDVGRTGLIFEGFGVDHIHAKLIPMHGTKGQWTMHESQINKYFDHYEGFLSSHDAKPADPESLERTAQKINT